MPRQDLCMIPAAISATHRDIACRLHQPHIELLEASGTPVDVVAYRDSIG